MALQNVIMIRILVFPLLFISLFLYSCADDDTAEEIPIIVPESEIITIPVVVHIVNYKDLPFEISDEKIRSQIKVLNEDFRKKNPDHTKTPEEFKPFVADVGIEFKLATQDPNGNATTGIIRTHGDVTGWNGIPNPDKKVEDLKLYFTEKGGQDAWPRDQYLNIYIAYLRDQFNKVAYAYATFYDVDPRTDGVVIDPKSFGTIGDLEGHLNKGRTATHEIGHWLGLKHIFGRQDNCEIGDDIDDTPTQFGQILGKPTHPKTSCGSNDMFMNFMNYADDDAMYMFTEGQKEKMRSIFYKDGGRRALYLNIKD